MIKQGKTWWQRNKDKIFIAVLSSLGCSLVIAIFFAAKSYAMLPIQNRKDNIKQTELIIQNTLLIRDNTKLDSLAYSKFLTKEEFNTYLLMRDKRIDELATMISQLYQWTLESRNVVMRNK